MRLITVICCCLLFQTGNSQAPVNYAKRMAETVMKMYRDSLVTVNPEPGARNRPANWNYEIGVLLMSFERLGQATGEEKYLQYTKKIIDNLLMADGAIRTYKMDDYNIDNITTGRQLLKLYEVYKDEKYKKASVLLRNQLALQPRNRVGGFWHKLKYPSQMWLDGLYMAEPFYAEYTLKNNTPGDFNDIINQFVWMEKYSRDSITGLLYHAWDESKLQNWANPVTGKSPGFWSRSMGWYLMALVDVLDFIPVQHPRRNELIQILNRFSKAIIKFQDPSSGVWWQVTDKGTKQGNYLESSGSSMFVFGLAKAVRMGYIDRSFIPAITKGYHGLIKEFTETDSAGNLHLTKAVSVAGLGGNRDGSFEYYISEPIRTDDFKAIGPFIQACLEMEWINSKTEINK